jgi:endoglucanase
MVRESIGLARKNNSRSGAGRPKDDSTAEHMKMQQQIIAGCKPPLTITSPSHSVQLRLSRRSFLGGVALSCATWRGHAAVYGNPLPSPHGQAEWLVFRKRFVTPEGRIVDTGNGNVSHTEGQGIGLLCAATFGDREQFDQIHGWTCHVLQHSTDALHAWRFRPNVAVPVADNNNATDGDLLIGLALLTAADRWPDSPYRKAGLAIARDVLRLLVRRVGDRYLLLPGGFGFEQRDAVIVNPSYYVFPALRRFAQELPDPLWNRLWDDGLAVVHGGRFGRWNLPPDWLTIPHTAGAMEPSGKWPARFSFDAVRLPLYLRWGGVVDDPITDAARNFWSANGGASCPAWVDLNTGEMAPYPQSGGMVSIQRYVASSTRQRGAPAPPPMVADARDYYSAALTMLVNVAEASGHSFLS